jgi:hypothetical protein
MKMRRTRFLSPRGISFLSRSSPGARAASRNLANGAVSARACLRQIGRPAARTGNDSQATSNSQPAADPWSRRRAS